MKKFAKVSISLIVVFGIFIGTNKLVFKDRVSIEDYKLRNTMYTTLRIDSYRDTEDGLVTVSYTHLTLPTNSLV